MEYATADRKTSRARWWRKPDIGNSRVGRIWDVTVRGGAHCGGRNSESKPASGDLSAHKRLPLLVETIRFLSRP